MKVALVCHSDLLGGASVVTFRLMQALRHRGVDARLIVYTKLSDDSDVTVVGSRFMRGLKFMAERLRIFVSNGFKYDNLFKVSIANTGYPIHKHPWVKEADVVALNWVNQGLMSLQGIKALGKAGKPVVWTMHDMWCCTGICHHAYECTNFEGECGNCPLLHSSSSDDLSHKVWLKKKALYDKVPIHFVAVSNWLAGRCAKSGLLAGRDVRVIHNAFPVDTFTTELKGDFPLLNIDFRRTLIVMGAARLDDPIKGLDYAIDALNLIFDNNPAVAKKTTAVFFGDLRNPAALDRLRFPYTWLGHISDPMTVRALFAAAKVVLSTSLYETLPGTLIEGQAAGCLPVTFGRGGQSDIVTHLKDGYIAEYKSAADIAKGLCWAIDAEPSKEELHESVRERFAATQIADRYIELFKEITTHSPMQTVLFHSTIFGPIHSRRLGTSLGVNLTPNDGKICSFDCLYCEAGFNAQGPGTTGFPSRAAVKQQLEAKLKSMKSNGENLDVITFSGNGEPTLHPDFEGVIDDTIELRDKYFPAVKISVLSNSTRLAEKGVDAALRKVDNNILKLDSAVTPTMRLIDRPNSPDFTSEKVIEQLAGFGKDCIVQTMMLRGSHNGQTVDNTTPAEINALIEAYKKINPAEVMLYSIDRKTPEQALQKVEKDELEHIADTIRAAGIKVQVS